MARPPFFFALFAVLLSGFPASAQPTAISNEGLITLTGDRTIRSQVITVRNGSLIITAPTGNGIIGVPYEETLSIQFELPEAVQTANRLYAQGQFQKALDLYRGFLPALAAFGLFPPNNALAAATNAIDCQRQLRLFDELNASLELLPKALSTETIRTVDLFRLAALTDAGDLSNARKALDALPEVPESGRNLGLELVLRARLSLAEDAVLPARKYLGRAIALLSINDPHYPEALGLTRQLEATDSPYAAILRTTRAAQTEGNGAAANLESSPDPIINFLKYCYADNYWSTAVEKPTAPTN